MPTDNIQVSFTEAIIQADFIENNISISFSEDIIQADFIENNINVDFIEDTINVSVESAIVNYTGASVKYYNDIFTLTVTDINNKFLFLTNTPLVNSATLFISGSPQQVRTKDYSITGSTLLWAGYPLEQDLVVGEELEVNYSYQ